MKHIPQEYLNQKVKLTKKGGRVVYGYITEINSTFLCFETKSKTSLLGINFIEDVVLAKISHAEKKQMRKQKSIVENLPPLTEKSNSRNNVFQYSKWWKNWDIQE